jgi:UDP-glucose 4-epimerase
VINFAGVQPSILHTSESTDMTKTFNDYVNINIVGVFNILEYVRLNNIGTYIYTTTHRDYELYWNKQKKLTNNLPTNINYKGDHSMYAITKTSAKMIGDYYGGVFNTRVFNFRLPMMFMIPDDPYYLKDGEPTIMPFLKVIKDAINGRKLEIWGDPKLQRDYVYVENLMSLIELSFKSNLPGGTFNVGTGEGVSTENFIKTIGKVFGGISVKSKDQYIYKPEYCTYKSAVYDVSEQKEKLDYEPILLEEMLKKMKEKIYSEGYLDKWRWS